LIELLAVMAGGAFGSGARYLLTAAVHGPGADGFPWGTFAVNLLGCLSIGVLAGMIGRVGYLPAQAHHPLVIGFLGGFTTYSAFALDAVRLFELGLVGPALAYVVGTTLLGIAAAAAGLGLTRTLGLG